MLIDWSFGGEAGLKSGSKLASNLAIPSPSPPESAITGGATAFSGST